MLKHVSRHEEETYSLKRNPLLTFAYAAIKLGHEDGPISMAKLKKLVPMASNFDEHCLDGEVSRVMKLKIENKN